MVAIVQFNDIINQDHIFKAKPSKKLFIIHYKGIEYPYKFQGLDKLWKDFMHDIEQLTEEDYEG